MKHLLLVPALALLSACGAQAPQDAPAPAAPTGASSGSAGGAASGACLVGDPDCQDTGPGMAAPPPDGDHAAQGEPVPFDAATAPGFVTDRPALPSCGTYGVGPRPLPQAVHDCLADAVGTDAGAEYVVADRTTEGDVVVRYYRALPGTTDVEVLLDATRDAFGSGRWERVLCTGYDATRGTATGCPPDGTGEV